MTIKSNKSETKVEDVIQTIKRKNNRGLIPFVLIVFLPVWVYIYNIIIGETPTSGEMITLVLYEFPMMLIGVSLNEGLSCHKSGTSDYKSITLFLKILLLSVIFHIGIGYYTNHTMKIDKLKQGASIAIKGGNTTYTKYKVSMTNGEILVDVNGDIYSLKHITIKNIPADYTITTQD